MILSSILQAIGLFIATNIDDIIVLSLFFARGAGQRGTTTRIILGQYLGFTGILGAAVLVSLGAGAFLPPEAIPYFGLIPLGLGLWAAWEAWRDDDDVWTVAGVTFANGGDNIGVYVPVFLSVGPAAVVAYCIVFLLLVAVLVGLAHQQRIEQMTFDLLHQDDRAERKQQDRGALHAAPVRVSNWRTRSASSSGRKGLAR